MRSGIMLGIFGVMAGFAVTAGPAGAALAPVASPDTRLHIEALGEVPPDTATFTVSIEAVGADPAGADRALDDARASLVAALGNLGVAAGDVTLTVALISPPPGAVTVTLHTAGADAAAQRMAQIEAAARARSGTAAMPIVPGMTGGASASGVLSVTLRDLSKKEQVARVLGAGNVFAVTQGVRLYAADPDKAHRAAVAQALAKARVEAGIYTAALGWRVLRVERVSNAKPGLSVADLIGTLARVDGAGAAGRSADIAGTSYAGVAIDFVVGP